MRCSTFVALAFALVAAAAPQQGKGKGRNAGNGKGQGGAAAAATSTGAAAAAATGGGAAAATNGTAAAAGGAAAGKGAAAAGDAQASLTIDPKCVADFKSNGQEVPAAGQVASLTSTNNFVNFCLTSAGTPLTNGKQIKTGSYNPAPIGFIPSTDNMPSSKFVFPKNGDTVDENKAFTIQMAVKNLVTGNFVNAQENYFSAPQQLKGGQIVGHSHVVVEKLTALDQTTTTDPNVFAFFKGLNAAAVGGVLTADVTAGLPAGFYRLASINTAANHQPAIVPVAQHGSLDDIIYFTVGKAGAAAAAAAGGAKGAAAAAAAAPAAAGAKGAAAAAPAAAAGTKGAAAAAPAAAGAKGAADATGAAADATKGAATKGADNAAAGGKAGKGKRMFPSRMRF